VYPVIFDFDGFVISSFGVMMAVGFLVSAWIVGRRLREYGLDPELSSTILVYAVVGGVVGSKLYFAVDEWLRTGEPFLSLLLNRAGITWYGGLIGGTLAVTLGTKIHRIPTRIVASCVAVAAPFGQACGRIGCFLVGDDYGRETDLPWGVAFPKGAPPTVDPVTGRVFAVHPTQLYEVAWLLAIGALLWRRRKRSPFLFGEYLMLAAIGRFAVEELRVNPEVALGLTEPRWIAILLFALGAAGWAYFRARPERVPAR
jgi:phosphatidylglycerol:prolipoprotein diacylglycerol transferase